MIRSKLLIFLKLKLQPLLLDPRLNSPDCVRDNLLRVCRGCAWRFLWLLHSRRLPMVTPVFVQRQTQRLVRYATRRADMVREGDFMMACGVTPFLDNLLLAIKLRS